MRASHIQQQRADFSRPRLLGSTPSHNLLSDTGTVFHPLAQPSFPIVVSDDYLKHHLQHHKLKIEKSSPRSGQKTKPLSSVVELKGQGCFQVTTTVNNRSSTSFATASHCSPRRRRKVTLSGNSLPNWELQEDKTKPRNNVTFRIAREQRGYNNSNRSAINSSSSRRQVSFSAEQYIHNSKSFDWKSVKQTRPLRPVPLSVDRLAENLQAIRLPSVSETSQNTRSYKRTTPTLEKNIFDYFNVGPAKSKITMRQCRIPRSRNNWGPDRPSIQRHINQTPSINEPVQGASATNTGITAVTKEYIAINVALPRTNSYLSFETYQGFPMSLHCNSPAPFGFHDTTAQCSARSDSNMPAVIAPPDICVRPASPGSSEEHSSATPFENPATVVVVHVPSSAVVAPAANDLVKTVVQNELRRREVRNLMQDIKELEEMTTQLITGRTSGDSESS